MSIAEKMEKRAREFVDRYAAIREQIHRVIVGHEDVVHGVLTCLFVGGHCLLEGVPGLARRSWSAPGPGPRAAVLPDPVHPDLMPPTSSATTWSWKHRREAVLPVPAGPVFTQILLADEINRATPKTQSALLETMQEGTVTSAGTRYELQKPYLVMATQNPIEQEGTYPLPEAQLDRFFFKLLVGYSTARRCRPSSIGRPGGKPSSRPSSWPARRYSSGRRWSGR